MNSEEVESELVPLTNGVSPRISDSEFSPTTQSHVPKPTKSWRQKISQRLKEVWRNNRAEQTTTPHEFTPQEILKGRETVNDALSTVFNLIIPLSLCFIVGICILKNLPFFQDDQRIVFYLTPLEEKADSSLSLKFGTALANSLIFISIVIVQTIIMVLLYKYKFYKVLYSFFFFSTLLLLFMSSLFILSQVIIFLNIPMDWITISLAIWNFSVVGLVCIFTDVSPMIQRAYHILTTAFFSCIFTHSFPDWTAWIVMVILVVWDLVAVLAPFGPLKMLVNLAQERDESIFTSLIYKTMIEFREDSDDDILNKKNASSSKADNSEQVSEAPVTHNPEEIDPSKMIIEPVQIQNNTDSEPGQVIMPSTVPDAEPLMEEGSHEEEEEEDTKGDHAQLGLGDFIFYSLLIGKTLSYNDWSVTISCFIAIIFGLMATFTILIIYARALPALPISLVLGLIFYFSTYFMVSPYYSYLTVNQIVV